MKKLCIYHGHCDDGFAAAYIVRQFLGDHMVEFHAGVYQQPPPDVTGRDVIMVDFSYKRPVIMEMASKAKSMLIIDHHKTAEEDLASFSGTERNGSRVACIFDMERSGAGLTWDFFAGGEDRPLWVDYIEDRDLWRKQLPEGDEFTIALRSYPQTFEAWDDLLQSVDPIGRLIIEGRTIQRYYRQRIEEMKRSAYPAYIDLVNDTGLVRHRCWVANAPYFAASEVAGELCEREGAEFGACYFEVSPGHWQYSLRSRNDFDVSKIALAFGGGGHQRAAGFTARSRPIHIVDIHSEVMR